MLKAAKDDLGRSCISEEEADFAEMYSVSNASTIYEDFKETPALVIPYVDPWTGDFIQFERDGKQLPFCRVRYYTPPEKVQSFKKRKELRYTQPSNSGIHPYFPVVEDIDWLEVAQDTDIPLMITEGEKKALCACLVGIPTIGLGGVYNFAQDGELLPMLDRIDWEDRTVYICYDSDAAENNKIAVAEGRLATELSMKRKANVFLVRLPDGPGGKKVGVDDFVAKDGEDALFDLLEKAPEMRKIDKEVLSLNQEAAWIESEGLVLNLKTDAWIKKADFTKGSKFSTRQVMTLGAKNSVKYVSVPDVWLTHPHARRYDDTVFRPGTDAKSIQLPHGGIAYNRFRGLNPMPGDVQPFFDLYDWIMSRTDEFDHDLLWKTIAYKMQNLEEAIGLGVILLGKQGGGKSLFCEIMAQMVEPYGRAISSDMLDSDYNPWVETSLVVVMNEAKSKRLKYNMDKLKTYVTDQRQPMNDKYRKVREILMYALMIFNSNEKSAGAFADDDRRMLVIGCPDTHPAGDQFYAPIYEWLKNDGPKKLLNFFMNYDLEGWKPPRHAPQTREKRMAYFNSLTPVQKLGHAIKDANENLVAQWITASMEWAASEAVPPSQVGLAQQIQQSLAHLQIRPFYTPEELALMFPAIASTLSLGRYRDAAPGNLLAQELMQQGVDYLRCADNFDGFLHKGQVRQYLIIADTEQYQDPITQRKFDQLMKEFPSYREWRALKRARTKKRKRRG